MNDFNAIHVLKRAANMALGIWRPMLMYILLIWAFQFIFLAPFGSWILGKLSALPGDVIVGNYTIAHWVFSFNGLLFLILFGPLTLMGISLQSVGLFLIPNELHKGRIVTAREIVPRIFQMVPKLIQGCLVFFFIYVLFFMVLAIGPGVAKLLLLKTYDINYYLNFRPPEWKWALVIALVWGIPWICFMLYVTFRWIYILPGLVDHNLSIRESIRFSWKTTRGKFLQLLRTLGSFVALWILIQTFVDGILFIITGFALQQLGDSPGLVLFVITGYLIISTIIRAIIFFLGIAWVSCVRVIYYQIHDKSFDPILSDHLIEQSHQKLADSLTRIFRLPVLITIILILFLISGMVSAYIFRTNVTMGKRPLVIAHRAGAAYAPENTIAALKIVLEQGVTDIVEIDVQITADGKIVAVHDNDLMKVALDPHIISETDFNDLRKIDIGVQFDKKFKGERLAELHTFFKMAKGKVKLLIEFKGKENLRLIEETLKIVQKYNMEEEVIMMSLELGDVRNIQRLASDIQVGYFASVEIGDLTKLNVDIIAPNDRLVTREFVNEFHELGILVYPWTIDDPLRIVELIEMGVDGIISNDPVLVDDIINHVSALDPRKRVLLRFRKFWRVFDKMDRR